MEGKACESTSFSSILLSMSSKEALLTHIKDRAG